MQLINAFIFVYMCVLLYYIRMCLFCISYIFCGPQSGPTPLYRLNQNYINILLVKIVEYLVDRCRIYRQK